MRRWRAFPRDAISIAAIVLLCLAAASSRTLAADENSDLARATALNQQAIQLYKEGRYAEATSIAKEALAIRERALGPDHPDVAVSLNNLAQLYRAEGRDPEAEPLLKRSLAIREKALAPDHPAVALSLNNLAALYRSQGRDAEAEPLYQRSLAIREKVLGPDSLDVALSLNNLALLYQDQDRYAEAEPLYQRSLAIHEKVLGPDHPDVAVNLNNLAAMYNNQARDAEAEPLYQRSLAIREKVLGPNHPDVAVSLNNLAELYRRQGRYAEAEPLYKRSLAIREKALGPDHASIALNLNNLAALYDDQGRYAEAEPLYKRSLAIREKALGPDHPDVAVSLNNLAVLFVHQRRYAEAEPLHQRSLAIYEKVLGPNHPDVAVGLNNLAALYNDQGRNAEAEPLYRRSLAIREKALGPNHPAVAVSLNNLAELYSRWGRDAEAEPLYQRSLAIREKVLGPNHLDVAVSLNNLAVLYDKQGRGAEALSLSRRAVSIVAKRFEDSAPQLGGGEDARPRSNRTYFLVNVALTHHVSEPSATAESFRVAQLASASTTAKAVAGMAARFAAGSDAMAAAARERQDLAGRWRALDKAIVQATSRSPLKRDAVAEDGLRRQIADTGAALEALDARIAQEFPSFAELSNPKPLELSDAQALLLPDEAMLVYLMGDNAGWLWALRRDRASLFKLDIGGRALSVEVAALRSQLDPDLNVDSVPFDAKRAYALYQKIIAPAASTLDGAHEVFVVADGALESLPFGVLVTREPAANPENAAAHRVVAWLAREYALTVLPSVGSLRALRQFTSARRATSPFAGIGNPVLKGSPSEAPGVKLASLFRGRLANVDAISALPSLPETEEELRVVAREMGADEGDLYLADRASEPLLRRAQLDRYRVIEFATHGLMSGDIEGLAEPALVLTPPARASPENDGLLTASKIATLKLDADWVVLSACNTAAADGTPDAGGLSGLAKAFFYAGARSILVSHWSVASKATVKLMTDTFAELKMHPQIGRAEALRRAEVAMLDPKNPPQYAHPMMWAPFVLAGEGSAQY